MTRINSIILAGIRKSRIGFAPLPFGSEAALQYNVRVLNRSFDLPESSKGAVCLQAFGKVQCSKLDSLPRSYRCL